MTTPLDRNGHPDIMGPRPMNEELLGSARALQDAFNQVHAMCVDDGEPTPEAERLLAMARTHLEIASMCAVKAISRL